MALAPRQLGLVEYASTIELRESKGGKYLGVTVTITATSREQLDELYRTLSTHPMVKVVL
jgi:putative lipoic acid-binding regulatory protein